MNVPLTAAPVTVSIVLHGQWKLARPLIADLQRHSAHRIAKVLLTVNKPEPGIDLSDFTLPVHRIDNTVPRGFGVNHNAAFAQCCSPWFLVLNPDLRLNGDVLGGLLEAAEPRSGLLTPYIQEPGKEQPEPFRRLLTPLELWDRRRPDHCPPPHPDWVGGMFMLLRHEAFAQVGGFDDRYFMYCEDVDLCARLQLAGWRLQICEHLQALHDAQRRSHSSFRALRWHVVSLSKWWLSGAFWRFILRRRQLA